MNVLANAGVMALASMFVGVLPLTVGVVYAIWPTEQRLMLTRTLSLATVFAVVAGATRVSSTSCASSVAAKPSPSRHKSRSDLPNRWFPYSSASGV